MIATWGGVVVASLLCFAAGMVVGIMAAVWIDQAEAEEAERREARKRHPHSDWRDSLSHEDRLLAHQDRYDWRGVPR